MLTINNLLTDLLICQTFFCQRLEKSQFAKPSCYTVYSFVVPTGCTKKFASFWKGPDTILDKSGPVNYKIQLIGGTQQSVVHHSWLKLCYTLPLQQPLPLTVSTQSMPEPQHRPTLYSDVTAGCSSGIAGYTSATNSITTATPVQCGTLPPRVHRQPSQYDDFVRLNLVRTQDLGGMM